MAVFRLRIKPSIEDVGYHTPSGTVYIFRFGHDQNILEPRDIDFFRKHKSFEEVGAVPAPGKKQPEGDHVPQPSERENILSFFALSNKDRAAKSEKELAAKFSKAAVEKYARDELGIELDKRKSLKGMLEDIELKQGA